MHYSDMKPIDCSLGPSGFLPVASRIVVSCFKLANHNAPNWIQNLAIANALGLLMSRIFEVLVWLCFQSMACIIVLSVFALFILVAVILAGLSGTFSSLITSWLGFIAMILLPFMIYLVRAVAIEIRRIKKDDALRLQEKTKKDFSMIAKQFSTPAQSPDEGVLRLRHINS